MPKRVGELFVKERMLRHAPLRRAAFGGFLSEIEFLISLRAKGGGGGETF